MEEIIFWILVLILFIFIVIIAEIRMAKARKEKQLKIEQRKRYEEKFKDSIKQYASISKSYGHGIFYWKLTINERRKEFFQLIKIRDDQNIIMDYEPARYIYTSATVGGITTGGVETIGGHDYVAGKVESGKCELLYLGEAVEQTIERIQLTDSLYEEAKKSNIKKYLNDEKQIVVVAQPGDLITATQICNFNSPMGSLVLQNVAKQGYPTRKKCLEIMNWICGID